MIDRKPLVRYNRYRNSIVFPPRIASGLLPELASAVAIWRARSPDSTLTLDFRMVEKAFANGMLGTIALTQELRRQGNLLKILLPANSTARRFFRSTNWAYLLDPEIGEGYKSNDKHFVKGFQNFDEIPGIVNHFMDIVLGHIPLPKDVLAALEWSITEICDNVINHACSSTGGLLQVIAYPEKDLVAFTVADAGQGILQSLKESIPDLKTDLEAIRQAVRVGVTRNKNEGQGNGLTGTLRITTMTGGSLDILTGSGRLLFEQEQKTHWLHSSINMFPGTCVSGQIIMSHDFSVVDALSFGTILYKPYTIVDEKYERADEDALYLKMTEQVAGAGTRAAGKEMRIKLMNLATSRPNYPIYLDWNDIEVIASSFADEFMGKLFVAWGKERFENTIRNINNVTVVDHIIRKAIAERSATS